MIHGPDEFKVFVEKLRGAFPDIHMTIEDAFASCDKVAVRWSATMTHTGDHLDIPASGKRVSVAGFRCSVIRMHEAFPQSTTGLQT